MGADPPMNFTSVNEAVNDPAPVYRNNNKLLPAAAVGIVNTQFPVRVQVCTFPFVKDSVLVVDELPIDTTVSVYAF